MAVSIAGRPMTRRDFLILSGAAATYPFLSGCGGGGDEAPQGDFFIARNVAIKPGVVVLPEDGSVSISGLVDSSLTLSGNVPAIPAGTILVSGLGAGFIRRVNSVTPVGTSVVLGTGVASLEDVFESAEIRFRKKLKQEPGDRIEVHAPGIRIGRSASRQDDPEGIPIVIPEFSIGGNPGQNVSAAAKFAANGLLDLDIDGEFDFTVTEGLKRVSLILAGDYNGSFTASTEVERTFIDEKAPLFTHVFSVRRIGNIGPVPLLLIPILTAQVAFKGGFKGKYGTSGDGFFRLAVGFNGRKRPTGDYDFTPIFAPAQSGAFASPNFFGSVEAEWVPWQLELVTSINALIGPTFKANLPAFQASVTPHPSTATVDMEVNAAFSGTVGAQAGLFGLALPIIEIPVAERKLAPPLFKKTFGPGTGQATVH